MDRPYLVLWFALALFGVLAIAGIYHRLTHEPGPPAATRQVGEGRTLEERLIEERRRRVSATTRGQE